jgi:hypothetical protein
MKQFAYAQKNENDLQLFLFDKPEPIQTNYPYEALMMSRIDFDIKVTEVPPVHESEMENLLTYKLRSLYPGDPESTVFDYKILARNKQRLAVIFISSKETIEEYKKISDKKPLFLSFPITNALMQKHEDEDCIFFYWHRNWVDISIYEKGSFISSSAIQREKEVFLDFLKMRNMLPKNFKEYRCVVISFSDEAEFLKEQSNDFFKDVEKIEFLTIEETLPLLSKKSDYLFYRKKKISLFSVVKFEYLLILMLFLGCLLVNKIVLDREAYRKKLESYMNNELTIAKQSGQFNQKKAELAKIIAKKPADMFVLLDEISKIFNNEVDISTIRIETKIETKGNIKTEKVLFTIDAKFTSDPLRYVDRFNKNSYFAEANIVKIDMDKRLFTLNGLFNKGGSNASSK